MPVLLPNRLDSDVDDLAKVLSDRVLENLRELLRRLRAEDGIDGSALTITRSADHGQHKDDIQPLATDVLNPWGIDDTDTDEGVLALSARDRRRVRIEPGAAYGHDDGRAMHWVQANAMLPRFRSGDLSGGPGAGVGLADANSSAVPTLFRPLQRSGRIDRCAETASPDRIVLASAFHSDSRRRVAGSAWPSAPCLTSL